MGHADDLRASRPPCVSAPLPLHFNIFQLFNIYYLCRFVLLISYSWPEEMYWRVPKRVHTLFFKGAISTTAALQTRTRCAAFGHHSLLGVLRHRAQEVQTSLTTPLQWLFKGPKDVVSHQERRQHFWKVQEPLPQHICADPCRNTPFPLGMLRKFT